jgi:hypothetical protein
LYIFQSRHYSRFCLHALFIARIKVMVLSEVGVTNTPVSCLQFTFRNLLLVIKQMLGYFVCTTFIIICFVGICLATFSSSFLH